MLFFSRLLPIKKEVAIYALLLSLVPLLGSFITEPAAMTLAAMLLGRNYFGKEVSNKFKYATLGVLFVNISIGGTLTPFAAPPPSASPIFVLNSFLAMCLSLPCLLYSSFFRENTQSEFDL